MPSDATTTTAAPPRPRCEREGCGPDAGTFESLGLTWCASCLHEVGREDGGCACYGCSATVPTKAGEGRPCK